MRFFVLIFVAQLFSAVYLPADEVLFESGASKVHLLELYTSEGCSSCPPAEIWLTKLKQHPGLWREFVPVAFHVDYWDHLGWRDRFAKKDWTNRQQIYAAHWNASSVYTPAVVLDGRESRPGSAPGKSNDVIGTFRLMVTAEKAAITFNPAKDEKHDHIAHVAVLGCALSSDVAAGENRGRKLTHDFVVLSVDSTSLPNNRGEIKLSADHASAGKNAAIAAWITAGADPKPIQATGGWLPSG